MLSCTTSRLALAALLAFAVAGCARDSSDGFGMVNASAIGAQGVLASSVPPTAAVAMLSPAAGRVVQVAERRYVDGISQDIVLAGDSGSHGENKIEVSVRLKPAGDQVYDNLIPLRAPSDIDVVNEMEARFPGVDMQIVNVLLQNRYGPYGLAAGRRGANERCIYAWQWIEDIGAPPSPRTNSLANAVLSPPLPASIRVRLCRTGVTADQLAGLMDGISIGVGMGNRQFPILGRQSQAYGNDALSAAGSLGGQAFAGYQLPQTQELAAAEPARRAAPRRHIASRPHRYVRVARRATRTAPNPDFGTQPLAPEALQQTYAPPQAYQPPQTYAPQPAYAPQNQAPQVYSPQIYAQPPARVQALKPLDPSLPAQAYAGPNGTNAIPRSPGVGQAPNRPMVPGQAPRRLTRDPSTLDPGV